MNAAFSNTVPDAIQGRDRAIACRIRPTPFVVVVKPGAAPGAHHEGGRTMRFMVIVKANAQSEAGIMPSEELLGAMGAFNEEMVKAGIMLDGAGLKPSSAGARIVIDGGKRTVVDGPFAESKELVAGYWIIDVKSKDEAIQWMMRVPNPHNEGGVIEIRPFYELEDFGESPAIERHRALDKAMAEKR
jgi:hypothetical protein